MVSGSTSSYTPTRWTESSPLTSWLIDGEEASTKMVLWRLRRPWLTNLLEDLAGYGWPTSET